LVETSGGGLLETVHRRLREELPLQRLKLKGLALDSLRLHCDGRLALMAVTPATLKAAGAVMADTEDLVELGRSLAGVTLSALIKDHGAGRLRVSLRSREPVNASALASLFGGGGHRLAAAYNDDLAATAEEAAANLLARAGNFL
jgi:phosphoesterase RecJ-like protein